MDNTRFFLYLFVMAAVTYLIRMLPLVLFKKKIKNRFVLSFLYYIPYAVLTVMTIPGVFYQTQEPLSCVAGFVVAVLLAFFEKSLLTVAAFSCGTVLVMELVIKYVV